MVELAGRLTERFFLFFGGSLSSTNEMNLLRLFFGWFLNILVISGFEKTWPLIPLMTMGILNEVIGVSSSLGDAGRIRGPFGSSAHAAEKIQVKTLIPG